MIYSGIIYQYEADISNLLGKASKTHKKWWGLYVL